MAKSGMARGWIEIELQNGSVVDLNTAAIAYLEKAKSIGGLSRTKVHLVSGGAVVVHKTRLQVRAMIRKADELPLIPGKVLQLRTAKARR